MNIIEINPRDCTRWKYADRSFFEFGDLGLLAESIKKYGQIEPVYVRTLKEHPKFKYEVLAGSRRWKACLNEDLTMKAIVHNVSDFEASIVQIKENEKVTISEYSKGMSFSKLKEDHKLTQDQLAEITGYSRRKIQNLLAFAKVDKAIWDSVSNISKVSAKSAETILSLSKKSETYKHALIEIAEEIRKGAGSKRIEQLVNVAALGEEHQETSNDLIQSSSGQVFAAWNNGRLCFSKNINLDKKAFNEYLVKFFSKGGPK
ncbi:MAG: ParB/RepB/Spo0J family partition protein [Rickettsiaceae bacterium]|nr:ParB/RepB/Spo0J family partition protein [Rickettsiaceae bacterium]